ncbi:hypothetical protein [Streptomyces bluensis]|uniref:Uncharacterized protein n=1 Tax=Streptomyces bluensis TaxID=33897 RepID=A0ABW6UT09_9ACTN
MAVVPVQPTGPVRRLTWRAVPRHWAGLQFLVLPGRHHGLDSLAEQKLLLALDFVTVAEVFAPGGRAVLHAG